MVLLKRLKCKTFVKVVGTYNAYIYTTLLTIVSVFYIIQLIRNNKKSPCLLAEALITP